MASVKKVLSLADYKRANNFTSIELFKSKAGNNYGCVDGELVCWVAEDLDTTKPIMVMSMVEGTDEWNFMCNGTPEERKGYATV